MAKTSGELEKEFIETAAEKTGKSLDQWLSLVKSSGIEKRNDMLEWLKKTHALNHMQAQFVVGIYLTDGKPVYINETNLLENQFAKCEQMRPLFDLLSQTILEKFHGTQIIPKKTYVSFTAIREFAAVNIKPSEIRLGVDLGDYAFTEHVQKTKLTGPMPRISHMLIVKQPSDIDTTLLQLIELSYSRTHKK